MKLDPYIAPSTNTKSKKIKELNMKPETIKLLENRHNLQDTCTGKDSEEDSICL